MQLRGLVFEALSVLLLVVALCAHSALAQLTESITELDFSKVQQAAAGGDSEPTQEFPQSADDTDTLPGKPEVWYNEDEFEGFTQPEPASPATEEAVDVAPPQPAGAPKFSLEIACVVAIFVYAVNYVVGRSKNLAIVNAWSTAFSNLVRRNFSFVGPPSDLKNFKPLSEEAVAEQHNTVLALEQDSVHHHTLYATGRLNCDGFQASLDLLRRQDLFSLAMNIIKPSADTITLDFALSDLEPFVFAVVKKKSEKAFKLEHAETLGTAVVRSSIPKALADSYSVITDCNALVGDVLVEEVCQTLRTMADQVMWIMAADQFNSAYVNRHKKFLQVCLRIPADRDMSKLSLLMKMSFFLVDLISGLKLKQQDRLTAQKSRNKLENELYKQTHGHREEAAQQRKSEKKHKQAELEASMSAEALRKKEEKDKKKELKRKALKFKVMHA